MNRLCIKVFNIKIHFDNYYFFSIILISALCAQFILPYYYKQMSIVHCWISSSVAFLTFSFFVFFREIIRALYCKKMGFTVKKYTLFLFGSDQEIYEGNFRNLFTALSGIYGLLFTAASVFTLYLFNLHVGKISLSIDLKLSVKIVLVINFCMGLVNLLPIYTLDSGRVLKGLLLVTCKNEFWSRKTMVISGNFLCMLIMLLGLIMCFRGMIVGGIGTVLIGESLRRSLFVSGMNVLLNKTVEQIKINSSLYGRVYSALDNQSLKAERERNIFCFENKFNNAYSDRNSFVNAMSNQKVKEIPLCNQKYITMEGLACGNSMLLSTEKTIEIVKILYLMHSTGKKVCFVQNSTDSDYRAGVITIDTIIHYILKRVFT